MHLAPLYTVYRVSAIAKCCEYPVFKYMVLRVSEELAPRGIRDEIIWSLYASLD
jgi:hypothetical protein